MSSDFWRLRRKLDVPKERLISDPHCHRDGDPSLVAGWDHLQQAAALSGCYERMKTREGWPPERLLPLLAGLDQLVPWPLQWHKAIDREYDLKMGDDHRDFVRDEAQALGYTLIKVSGWEPPAKAARRSREEDCTMNLLTDPLQDFISRAHVYVPDQLQRAIRSTISEQLAAKAAGGRIEDVEVNSPSAPSDHANLPDEPERDPGRSGQKPPVRPLVIMHISDLQVCPSSSRVERGTSLATPNVAGTAALLLASRPGMTAEEIRAELLETMRSNPVVLVSGDLRVESSGGRPRLRLPAGGGRGTVSRPGQLEESRRRGCGPRVLADCGRRGD